MAGWVAAANFWPIRRKNVGEELLMGVVSLVSRGGSSESGRLKGALLLAVQMQRNLSHSEHNSLSN